MLLAKMDDAEYSDIGNMWIDKSLTCDQFRADRLNRNKRANLMSKKLSVPPPFNCLPPDGPLAQFDSNVSTSSPLPWPDAIGAPFWQWAETMSSENLHVSFPNDVLTSDKDARDICDMTERLGGDVDVFEFVAVVAPRLEDHGDGLRKALDSELQHFAENFVENGLEMSNADIDKFMQKQGEQREKCINWIQRVPHRTRKSMEWLETVRPNIDWSIYPTEQLKVIVIHEVYEVMDVGHLWQERNMLKLRLKRRQERRMEDVTALRKQYDELQRKIYDIEIILWSGEILGREKHEQKRKQHEALQCQANNIETRMFVGDGLWLNLERQQ